MTEPGTAIIRHIARRAPLAFLVLVLASAALAQNYPARRITIVVPFSPGTTFDLIARTLGQKVTEQAGLKPE